MLSKKQKKQTDSSNTVTKESENHNHNIQIQGAEAVSGQVEIAVNKTEEAKDTESSNTVTKESETQEAESVSEIAILQIDNTAVSPIVNIENESS